MYASAAPIQGAKNSRDEFATREARAAYVKAHRALPPALLESDERSRPWLVAPVLFPLVERLSRGAIGWCNATEASLRMMAWVDTGHLYGERSISRRLRVEQRRGRLFRKRLPPGAHFTKTNFTSRNGTTLNRFATEKERRERLWRERNEKRKARREARERKRSRERGERIARPSEPARLEVPRVAPVALVEREVVTFALPPSFLDAPREMTNAIDVAEHRRKVDAAIERARAMRDLWDDEPPDD